MELRQIAYFVAIAEAGSITAAATRLHMTQPPLSLTVTRLEAELGVRLLLRHPRGVTLTEAGRRLADAGHLLLNDERRLATALAAMGAGLSGELTVGAEPLGYWHLVAERAADFALTHPDVSLTLVDAPPGRLVEVLRRGDIDLAIIPSADRRALGAPAFHDIETVPIAQVPLHLAVPSTWDDLGPGPVHVTALADRTLILPQQIPGQRIIPEVVGEVFAARGGTPRRMLQVSTPHTALSLVSAGAGFTVAGLGLAEQLPTVRIHELEHAFPPLHLLLAWRRESVLTPVAELFRHSLRRVSSFGAGTKG